MPIINEILWHLNALLGRQDLEEASKDVYWTAPVKTAICEACAAEFPGPLHFCVGDVNLPGQQGGPPWLPPGEWRRYDVTCLRCNGDYLEQILLFAEVEWGNREKILEDFRKLLMERAQLRVMVFNLNEIPFEDLEEHVHQYGDNQPGDTYLLAAFTNGQIQYYQIDVDQALHVQGRRLP